MDTKSIVSEEICKIIGKFNPSKGSGHDYMTNMAVKEVAPEISKPV